MTYPHNHKIAIPKLERGPQPPPKAHDRHREDRVVRACKNCRKRKVKCSGNIPQCGNCQANGLNCEYEQARRDRLKEAIDLNHTLITLLDEISPQVNDADRKRIQDVIQTAEDGITISSAQSVGPLGKRNRRSSVSGNSGEQSPFPQGEAHVTASVGSNDDLDFLGEDLLRTRESRETGYVGQNSEVQWLRSVQRQTEVDDPEPHGLPYGPPGSSDAASDKRSEALHQRRQKGGTVTGHVTDSTFYLDSENIEIDIAVNPYELPVPDLAEQLLNCYMETVHSSFPIVPMSFQDQVRRFIHTLKHNKAFQVPDRWRALMNIIFAVGAKYSHLVGTEWQGDDRDHLVYMTRASHLLGMNNAVLFVSGPDLALVQATAVFTLYFLVIGHVSRAWLMVGISVRLAESLGLHLRNEDPSADAVKKEMLSRTWWSLHSIECLISSITGRPPVIALDFCTVPLPNLLPNEAHHNSKGFRRPSHGSGQGFSKDSSASSGSSMTGRYLVSSIEHSLLTRKVLSSLYAPRTAVQSWQNVQGEIKQLLSSVEDRAKNALPGNVVPDSPQESLSEREREQLHLRMQYWSTKILITRPCLCRTDRRIKNQSDESAKFNAEMSKVCVNAAHQLVALFPDPWNSDPTFVYKQAPWWSIIHLIMQCAAVLLLEIVYEGRGKGEENPELGNDLKKLMSWLRTMQSNDPVASRAYHVLRRILQNCAPNLQAKAAELLAESTPSQATNEQSSQNSFPPHTQQQSGPSWGQGDFFVGSTCAMGHQSYFPSQGTDSDYPQYSYDHAPNANFNQVFPTFGNPFQNGWDEGSPVIDMQSLWHDPNYDINNTFQEDLVDTNLLDLENTDLLRQQQ